MGDWTIDGRDEGRRIDAWLAERPEIGSRRRARDWIARGKILRNGRVLAREEAGEILHAGDVVCVWADRPGSGRRPMPGLAAARGALRILHEDDSLLLVDKPAGWIVEPLPGAAEPEITLRDLVADHLRGLERARPLVVHRIDRDTTGVVLFAKNAAAQARLKDQFEARSPERVYLAVLRGRPAPAEGTWRDRLVWDPRSRAQRRAHPKEARGKEAVARYRVREQFADAALVEVRLVTGKRNQIRVQAGLRGHALVGETVYRWGAPPPAEGEPALERQALHAWRLGFVHPTTGRPLQVTAPVPADFERLLEELRRTRADPSSMTNRQ